MWAQTNETSEKGRWKKKGKEPLLYDFFLETDHKRRVLALSNSNFALPSIFC